ncbi:unnamed protein product [Leuciscus chuanchicus]
MTTSGLGIEWANGSQLVKQTVVTVVGQLLRASILVSATASGIPPIKDETGLGGVLGVPFFFIPSLQAAILLVFVPQTSMRCFHQASNGGELRWDQEGVIFTPAIYPRFIEFLDFDIHSPGQKSHRINTLRDALF